MAVTRLKLQGARVFSAWLACIACPVFAAAAEPVRYTVVATLRHETRDPEARAAVERFNAALLDELRKVPQVTVRVADAAEPASRNAAEYQLVVTSLATSTTPTGFTAYRAGSGQAVFNGTTLGNPWPVELKVEKDGQPAPRTMGLRTTTLLLARSDASRPGSCATSRAPPRANTHCLTMAQVANYEAQMLRTSVFPMDPAMRDLLLARVADGTKTDRERADALFALRRSTGRAQGAALDAGVVAAIIQLARELPGTRAQISMIVRGAPTPELVPLLVESTDRRFDDYTRQEALVTLLTEYAGDARVRGALAQVAMRDASEMLRAMARYPASGIGPWRDHALATLRKKSLSDAEKVRPLAFTVDQTMGAFRKDAIAALAGDARIVDALLVIARANRTGTTVQQRAPIRRALYALQGPESGPVLPGTPRQEVQDLYREYTGPMRPGMPPGWMGLPRPEARPPQ
jgi:hypothetical protein